MTSGFYFAICCTSITKTVISQLLFLISHTQALWGWEISVMWLWKQLIVCLCAPLPAVRILKGAMFIYLKGHMCAVLIHSSVICAPVRSCVDRNPSKVSKPSAVLWLVKHCSRCVRMRSLTCCLKDLCWCWITSHGQRAHRRGHSNTSVLPS